MNRLPVLRHRLLLSLTPVAVVCLIGPAALGQARRPLYVPPDSIVPTEVRVSVAPPRLTLVFHEPGRYLIYRRDARSNAAWGAPLATTGRGATEWTDPTAEAHKAYEYLIRHESDAPTFDFRTHKLKRAYLLGGIDVDQTAPRGKVIVAVDKTLLAPLADELDRLREDLVGDGWQVVWLPVARGEGWNDGGASAEVRKRIVAAWKADPRNTRHLLLLGHVVQPRTGLAGRSPDGHAEGGAYATDSFYADVDGVWTDRGAFQGKGPANKPGDGWYDQLNVETGVEMGFGRVDMYDLPVLGEKTEIDALRTYLDKEHAYRHARWNLPRTALLREGHYHVNMNARQAFVALVGEENFKTIDKKDLPQPPRDESGEPIRQDSDLMYANAHGPVLFYARGSGIPLAADFAARGSRALCWFGWQSGWGYWNRRNNVMRTALGAEGNTLLMFWMTRIRYPLHLMGLGDPAGWFIQRTVNNYPHDKNAAYLFPLQPRNLGRRLEGRATINLIGNPTLRLFPAAGPSNLAVLPLAEGLELRWAASPAADLVGYHVYRAADRLGPYTRLTDDGPVRGERFVDDKLDPNAPWYMVRAVARVTTGSGTFLNGSQGVFARASRE